MKKQQKKKKEGVTTDEVSALDEILDGVLSTWDRGVDEREYEQIALALSLSDKLGAMVRE